LGIPFHFYHLNQQLEITEKIEIQEDEALLYTNYYGLKSNYIAELAVNYGSQLIIDNSQAFFSKPLHNIDSFYTCRKFFGVPDGAYLYTQAKLIRGLEHAISYEKVSHLIKRIDVSPEEGFIEFQQNEGKLEKESIRLMSKFTERMMQSIDYDRIAKQRRENYKTLHAALGPTNHIHLPMDPDAVPMVYPYLSERDNLRQHLIQNKIYIAIYWPNVMEWVKADSLEYFLTSNMLPLPIDQRYGKDDMNKIIRNIL